MWCVVHPGATHTHTPQACTRLAYCMLLQHRKLEHLEDPLPPWVVCRRWMVAGQGQRKLRGQQAQSPPPSPLPPPGPVLDPGDKPHMLAPMDSGAVSDPVSDLSVHSVQMPKGK